MSLQQFCMNLGQFLDRFGKDLVGNLYKITLDKRVPISNGSL